MRLFQIILFFILFPLLSVLFIKKSRSDTEQLYSRNSSRYLQGLAAVSVVLGHYIYRLEESGCIIKQLSMLSAIGTISVSILFFLSGYGIYESHGITGQKIEYLGKKILHLLIPYWVIGLAEIIIDIIVKEESFELGYAILYIIGISNPLWFIWVLIAMYIMYFLVSQIKLSHNGKLLICLMIIVLASVVMYFIDIPSYWYRNNIFFVIGMIVSEKEKILINIIEHISTIILAISIITFTLACFLYRVDVKIVRLLSTIVMSAVIITFTFVFFRFFSVGKKNPMFYMGNKTIYIYILHTYIYLLIKYFFDMTKVLGNVIYFMGLFCTVIGCYYFSKLFQTNNKRKL